MNDGIKMQISAFVDDELPDNESELLLRRLSQDLELRQQVAEYLAIGRGLRGQRSVAGIKKLRDRIAAAVDDKSLQEEFDAIEPVGRRFLRPVAGVAIAATVALVAILGLQQMTVTEIDVAPSDDVVAESVNDDAYTVPEQPNEQLSPYYLRHNASGANNINARLVTLRSREDVIADEGAVVDDSELETSDVDAGDSSEQQTP